MSEKLLDARAAAERLKVSRATLYSYVSRGLIRTRPHPEDPRARLYPAADIDAFQRRKTVQHRPAQAAATTLDWGLPALESGISAIEDGRLTYRGKDAVALSESASLEDVANLLWQHDRLRGGAFDAASVPLWPGIAAKLADATGLARAQVLLPLLAGEDPGAQTAMALASRGAILVHALAQAVVPGLAGTASMHERLAAAWNRPGAADAIRRALVLIADHEINASTFSVRVIASTGAGLTACVCGGLAALSGPLHGGATLRASAFVEEARGHAPERQAIRARLQRGDDLPGFGHRLYPDGDPRAAAILPIIDAPVASEIAEIVEAETGLRPNIDFALVALEKCFELPAGAALDLFTIGRSVGWIAHAIEQRETGRLIRPRARFVGSLGT